MSQNTPPTKQELRDWVQGKLSPDAADEMPARIQQFPEAEALLAELSAGDDSLAREIRKLRQEPSASSVETVSQSGTTEKTHDFQLAGNFNRTPDGSNLCGTQLREYQLLEKLGEGGMGAVYKATHSRLEKIVALKVLPAQRLQNRDLVARFEREMKAVGKLDHPNIVRATDAGEVDGIHFLVMEYVPGQDLAKLVDSHGPLPVADACEIIRQTAVGLQHAHQQGLVHRDIKPSNIMLARPDAEAGNEGSSSTTTMVKLLDLGLARLHADDAPGELTTDGAVMGTIDYMAPEQATDSHTVDIRADIYSLGCTLYKLLRGQGPFAGAKFSSYGAKIVAHATRQPEPLSAFRPDIPPELAAVVQRMLAKEKEDRYSTPGELARALQPFCHHSDLLALARLESGEAALPQALPPQTAEKTTGRAQLSLNEKPRKGIRPIWLAGGMSLVAVGICLLGWLVWELIFRVETPEGTVEVRVSDKFAGKVTVTQDRELRIIDPNDNQEIQVKVKAGSKELQLVKGGFQTEVRRFDLSTKAGRVLEVQFLPITKPTKVVEATPDTTKSLSTNKEPSITDKPSRHPDYKVAMWFLNRGGYVTVDIPPDRITTFTSVNNFPEQFGEVRDIDLRGDNNREFRAEEILAQLKKLARTPSLTILDIPFQDQQLLELITLLKKSGSGRVVLERVNLTPGAISALAECDEIKSLTLGPALTDEDLRQILKIDKLTSLTLSDANLTDNGLKLLAASSLSYLKITNCRLITDDGLDSLVEAKKLSQLHLSGCSQITDVGLQHLTACQWLWEIDVRQTKVTAEGIHEFQAISQRCKVEADAGKFGPAKETPPFTADKDRDAATWALDVGGQVHLLTNGRQRNVTLAKDIPPGVFRVVAVNLQDCDAVRDIDLVRLTPLSDLKRLNLSGTQVGDAGIAHIQGVTSLEFLVLNDTKVTDAGAKYLRRLKSVQALGLVNTAMSDESLTHFSKLHSLQALGLTGTKVTGTGLAHLKNLANLQIVELSQTKITDEGAAALALLTQLTTLDLHATQISEAGLEKLAALKGLSGLRLTQSPVSPEAHQKLQRELPMCRILYSAAPPKQE